MRIELREIHSTPASFHAFLFVKPFCEICSYMPNDSSVNVVKTMMCNCVSTVAFSKMMTCRQSRQWVTGSEPWPTDSHNKKLSYRRVTARCVLSVVILPIATQQCRNYLGLYDKSWPNWWYEVGGLVGGNVSWTMCTQLWRDRLGSNCLRCHKQTDDGRIVYIICIRMTCCGEIF